MDTKAFGNRPIMQIMHLYSNLDCREITIPDNATGQDLTNIGRDYADRLAYVTWLTHGGELGAYGLMDFINDLPGM